MLPWGVDTGCHFGGRFGAGLLGDPLEGVSRTGSRGRIPLEGAPGGCPGVSPGGFPCMYCRGGGKLEKVPWRASHGGPLSVVPCRSHGVSPGGLLGGPLEGVPCRGYPGGTPLQAFPGRFLGVVRWGDPCGAVPLRWSLGSRVGGLLDGFHWGVPWKEIPGWGGLELVSWRCPGVGPL